MRAFFLISLAAMCQVYFGQNADFESSTAGNITTTNQVTGWTITKGTSINSCNILTCCPNPPSKSVLYNSTTGYNDPMIGNTYTIFSVFGASLNAGGMQGNNFLKLGNSNAGATIEKLTKTFVVTSASNLLQYAFISVHSDASHPCCDQGAFSVKISVGSSVCQSYSVTGSQTTMCNSNVSSAASYTGAFPGISYHPWIIKSIDLSAFMGQTITVEFASIDCTAGGHYSYGYVDANITSLNFIVNGNTVTSASSSFSMVSCIPTVTISAPSGLNSYQWMGPSGFNYTGQTFTTTTPGTYTLITGQVFCGASILTIQWIYTPALINISSSHPVLCPGSTATLYASGVSSYTWSNNSVSPITTVSPIFTTSYSVSGINASGCTAVGVYNQQVSNTSLSTISASKDTICVGESVDLTANGFTLSIWSTGQTSSVITVAPANTSTFILNGENQDGCILTRTIQVYVDPCTGIKEDLKDRIIVYPNPHNGEFNMVIPEAYDHTRLIITNTLGQIVLIKSLSSGENKIRFNASNGQYLYEIKDKDLLLFTGKFQVE
jgi:hypothetical protein